MLESFRVSIPLLHQFLESSRGGTTPRGSQFIGHDTTQPTQQAIHIPAHRTHITSSRMQRRMIDVHAIALKGHHTPNASAPEPGPSPSHTSDTVTDGCKLHSRPWLR